MESKMPVQTIEMNQTGMSGSEKVKVFVQQGS